MTEEYEVITLFGKPALFTNARIDKSVLPEGVYAYNLRGSDYDPGYPIYIEDHVCVNHAGTVLTLEPLDANNEPVFMAIGDEMNFVGEKMTLPEFIAANTESTMRMENFL